MNIPDVFSFDSAVEHLSTRASDPRVSAPQNQHEESTCGEDMVMTYYMLYSKFLLIGSINVIFVQII